MARPQERHRDDAQRQQDPQPFGVRDPEERPPVQQHVPQRAAAEGSESGDQADADRVQPLARGLQQAGQGEGKGRRGLDDRQQDGEEGRIRHPSILARARRTASGPVAHG
jgi:hypothetical protein